MSLVHSDAVGVSVPTEPVSGAAATALRERMAREACYWSEPSTCHDAYCTARCIAVRPNERFWKAADAALAEADAVAASNKLAGYEAEGRMNPTPATIQEER